MAIDPVCKMQVDEKKAAATSEYNGKTYYFCAQICKTKFDKNPEQYARSLTVVSQLATDDCWLLPTYLPHVEDNILTDSTFRTGGGAGARRFGVGAARRADRRIGRSVMP